MLLVPVPSRDNLAGLAHDADLLTCDRHLEGLPRVRYLPKRGA